MSNFDFLSKQELIVRLEDAIVAIEVLRQESETDKRQISDMRTALSTLTEGLHILHKVSHLAEPAKYELLFRDFVPFKNIMAAYKPKRNKK